MMKPSIIAALIILSLAVSTVYAQRDNAPPAIALIGGTLIDVSNSGHSAHDIPNAVVVIRAGKIEASGPAALVKIPKDAKVVNSKGTFILPGLIDGFTGVNSQAQANAWLYMGVTMIVGMQGPCRGFLKRDAHPSPHIYPLDVVGSMDAYSFLMSVSRWRSKLKNPDDFDESVELDEDETQAQFEDLVRLETQVVLLGHELTAERTKFIISQSHRLGLITYGDFRAVTSPAFDQQWPANPRRHKSWARVLSPSATGPRFVAVGSAPS